MIDRDGRKNNVISIAKCVAGTSRRYVGRIDGVAGEAELHFTVRGATLISADHSEAPTGMRGTSAAMALVEYMVGDARANGCSPTTGSIPSGATMTSAASTP